MEDTRIGTEMEISSGTLFKVINVWVKLGLQDVLFVCSPGSESPYSKTLFRTANNMRGLGKARRELRHFNDQLGVEMVLDTPEVPGIKAPAKKTPKEVVVRPSNLGLAEQQRLQQQLQLQLQQQMQQFGQIQQLQAFLAANPSLLQQPMQQSQLPSQVPQQQQPQWQHVIQVWFVSDVAGCGRFAI